MILASGSPRRSELMRRAGLQFKVIPSNVDETIDDNLSPQEIVKRLSLRKASDVSKSHPGELVIGADTVVSFDDTLLGKPQSRAEAHAMLTLLSGKTHEVYTGVALIKDTQSTVFSSCSQVTFKSLTSDDIATYLDTGEYTDKAGAYAIQGLGAQLIENFEGDLNTIIGLPIDQLLIEMEHFCD